MVPPLHSIPPFGVNLGISSIRNGSVSAAVSLSNFQPVIALSNALLLAARAEADLMMTRIAAQQQTEVLSSIQSQSAASLPLPSASIFCCTNVSHDDAGL